MSLATLALTSAHHLYGARLYGTPWRAHVAHVAAWVAGAIVVCVIAGRLWSGQRAGRVAHYALLALTVAVCVAWLGLYEGGYNHTLKNLVVWMGLSDDMFRVLFPPAIYEPPGDLLFEVSGMLQFPVGLLTGHVAREWSRMGRES